MDLKGRLLCYIEPPILISMSLYYLLVTLFHNPLLLLSSPSAFRAKWFDNWWNVLGPQMAASPIQIDYIESLLSRAHGTVLELGPGGGDQSSHYKPDKIEMLYAAEPNEFLHNGLMSKAKSAGLQGKIQVLSAGAQPGSLLPALMSAGLLPPNSTTLPPEGIFDTIITIKSMCCAPRAQITSTAAVVQALLKPGGEYIFFEHLGNNTDIVTQAYCWLVDLIWPAIMGGCRLDGNLDSVVMGMGGWAKKDVQTIKEYQGYDIFRYVKGVCERA